jgi:hypothetical protein
MLAPSYTGQDKYYGALVFPNDRRNHLHWTRPLDTARAAAEEVAAGINRRGASAGFVVAVTATGRSIVRIRPDAAHALIASYLRLLEELKEPSP